MKSTLLALAAVPAAVLGQILDIPDDNRMVAESGVLRFPLRVSSGAPPNKGITKRQNDVALETQKTGTFYSIDLVLGTPGQTVSVNFDTGSSELWVNPVCSKSNDPTFCDTFGHFTSSSTFVDTQTQGSVQYGTGYANFNYGYDYVKIGSSRISQQIFGVAYDSEFNPTGIMGAGPALEGWENNYPLIIDNLATQGFINSRAFSLDIRALGSNRGSAVFGGIDTRKYSGPLEKRPIVPAAQSPDGYTRYWVHLDGISLNQDDGSKDVIFAETNGLTVLLDSGYTLSALPTTMFNKLVAAFPTAQPITGSDMYSVDCSVAGTKGTVDFTFGNTVINVPYADFVWQLGGLCYIGAFADDDFPVLGDTFLRAAYVVYDWDNRNIHLANNQDCGSKLVAIGSGPDAVPSLVGECGATSSTTSSSTSATSTTTSSSSTVSSSTEASTTSESSSTEASSSSATPSNSGESSSTTPTNSGESSTATPTNSGESSTATPTNSGESSTATPSNSGESSTSQASSTEGSSSAEASSTGASSQHTFSSTHYTNSSSVASTKTGGSSTTPTTPTTIITTTKETTEEPTTITSTFTTTSVYTITSCPPTVTKCPYGKVTTEVITSYTTFCPGGDDTPITKPPPQPTGSITKTFTTTKTYTITDCPGEGPCHKGELTTQIATETIHVCPESTATYTWTKTLVCQKGEDCEEGHTKTVTKTLTIQPIPTQSKPKPIPGCEDCAPPAKVTSTVVKVFTPSVKIPLTEVPQTGGGAIPTGGAPIPNTGIPGGNPDKIVTATKPIGCSGAGCKPVETAPAVVTAGAASFKATGLVALIMGAIAFAL